MTADPNDAANYIDCGFDISHNNTGLNFTRLVDNRNYCFVKVTEGTGFRDPQFQPYVTGLVNAGMTRLGAYHFAHHGDPIGQMQFFTSSFVEARESLGTVPDFLFMLDLERGANPPQETDGLTMVQYLQSLGINPVIYCGFDFWSAAHPELSHCAHMVAAYNDHPTSALPWRIPSADTYGWDLWQYTDGAAGPWAKTVPGGSDPMDLSCFNLKKHPEGFGAWWANQLAQTRQPTAAPAIS